MDGKCVKLWTVSEQNGEKKESTTAIGKENENGGKNNIRYCEKKNFYFNLYIGAKLIEIQFRYTRCQTTYRIVWIDISSMRFKKHFMLDLKINKTALRMKTTKKKLSLTGK